ncbi:MAG: PTS lactose/cellobiose transporter subunit IIA [Lachnospiraceae bacterium]|nr:PTS lactose/cellobiose transporter subunit IIA [Lachnospiraceae bacterium]
MDEKLLEVAMELVVNGGTARSLAMEAIALAKEGKFAEAYQSLEDADEALVSCHHVQTDLIQRTARGEAIEVSLLMVHAQDHLMTGILAKDLAKEIVELHEKKG